MGRSLVGIVSIVLAGAACSEIVNPTLDVSADQTTLAPGQKAQLTVIRHFEGGPFDNVTTQVVYGVDKPAVVTVAPDGVVTSGSATGTAIVTVTEKDDTASALIHFTVVATDAGIDGGADGGQ